MSLSLSLVAIEGQESVFDHTHPALTIVGLPRFLYLANYYLDAGHNLEKVAQLLYPHFEETFRKNFRRSVETRDVLLARDLLRHRVPSADLRFDMAKWALTLSKEFRRAAGMVCRNEPKFDQNEATLLTRNFEGFLSKRSASSGYLLKGVITQDDVVSAFVLRPEGAKGTMPRNFETAEAAIYEFCELVPFQSRDRSIIAYAEHFGQGQLVERLRIRCIASCAPPIPAFMSDEQKEAHAKAGDECFWTLIEYINWLTNHNPMDH